PPRPLNTRCASACRRSTAVLGNCALRRASKAAWRETPSQPILCRACRCPWFAQRRLGQTGPQRRHLPAWPWGFRTDGSSSPVAPEPRCIIGSKIIRSSYAVSAELDNPRLPHPAQGSKPVLVRGRGEPFLACCGEIVD